MIFLPKCRAFYVVLEKGHRPGEKGIAQEKRAWHDTMLKLARGNTTGNWYSISVIILTIGIFKLEQAVHYFGQHQHNR